jgi:protein-arginine kinase activator protein McsA
MNSCQNCQKETATFFLCEVLEVVETYVKGYCVRFLCEKCKDNYIKYSQPLFFIAEANNFQKVLIENSVDLEPEINKIVDENFWDLI